MHVGLNTNLFQYKIKMTLHDMHVGLNTNLVQYCKIKMTVHDMLVGLNTNLVQYKIKMTIHDMLVGLKSNLVQYRIKMTIHDKFVGLNTNLVQYKAKMTITRHACWFKDEYSPAENFMSSRASLWLIHGALMHVVILNKHSFLTFYVFEWLVSERWQSPLFQILCVSITGCSQCGIPDRPLYVETSPTGPLCAVTNCDVHVLCENQVVNNLVFYAQSTSTVISGRKPSCTSS